MGLKLSIPLTDMMKDESFSVPWIFVFFPRGGLKDRGLERELQKAYWNTGNIFLFLLLLPRTSVNNRQTSTLSFTHSGPGFLVLHNLPELARLMFTESVMPSNHLFLCGPLLLLPAIFPRIRVSSNESALCIRWPENRSLLHGTPFLQERSSTFAWCFSLSLSSPPLDFLLRAAAFPASKPIAACTSICSSAYAPRAILFPGYPPTHPQLLDSK